MEPTPDLGVHLVRAGEHTDEIDALADRLGGRVGLAGVLDDLNRVAVAARVPGLAVRWGFRPDHEDQHSRRWWPQGISTSADANPDEAVAGRAIVATSAYSKRVGGVNKGARVTFVDITDRGSIRYRHVLLVEPVLDTRGRVDVRPLHVHAGGIVWHGDHLYVAGTRRGITTFRLDDIVRVPDGGVADRLGIDNGTVHGFGYRYLLPARFDYQAVTPDGVEPMRYSFLSLDRTASPHELIAGEYGDGTTSTRLMRLEIDARTGLLRQDGPVSRPLLLEDRGVGHTQGATVVGGRWYLTTSAGRYRLGSVWAGKPGDLRRWRYAVPVGVEDVAYWPSTDQLWSLSEYPGHRYVFAMDRSHFT